MADQDKDHGGDQSFRGADRYSELSGLHGKELAEATSSAMAEDPGTGESVILPNAELSGHMEERRREGAMAEHRERQAESLRTQIEHQKQVVAREQRNLADLEQRLVELQ